MVKVYDNIIPDDICQKLIGIFETNVQHQHFINQNNCPCFTQVNLNQASQKNITKIDIIKIEELVNNRSLAKSNKDFLLADQIRAELKNIGIELIDKPGGITEWKQL